MRPQDLDCNAQGLALPVKHGELTRNDRGEYFIVTETCGTSETNYVGTTRWTHLDEMPFTEGQRQALITDYHAREQTRIAEARLYIQEKRLERRYRRARDRWQRTHGCATQKQRHV